jgi:Rho-binding antiterminator
MDNRGKPYVPIACSAHDALELAILRGQYLRIHWEDPAGTLHEHVLRPLDLKTQAGEEFLIAEMAGGNPVKLRLDHIIKATPA